MPSRYTRNHLLCFMTSDMFTLGKNELATFWLIISFHEKSWPWIIHISKVAENFIVGKSFIARLFRIEIIKLGVQTGSHASTQVGLAYFTFISS